MNKISAVKIVLATIACACSILTAQASAKPAAADVMFTGVVTCSRCLDLTQHKGFTPWSWAMYKLSQGDDIVIVTSGKIYRLQGDRQQLSKYIQDKVTVSGNLDMGTITVTNVVRPAKEK